MLLDGNQRAAAHHRMLLLTWGISAIYLFAYVRYGWIPHDEGTIGQSAERVLMGELPHRDFADTYTGGLSFLHALAFRVFGLNLLVPRYVLLTFALLWVPVLYRLAARFVTPVVAAAVTLCAVAWSLPNYFVALPSWYNLFFATFFAAALVNHAEDRRLRWIFAAGALAGLSMLAKITGIYLLAAGFLFLLYLEADRGADRGENLAAEMSPAAGGVVRWFALLAGAAAAVLLAIVLFGLLWRPSAPQVVHFFLPVAVACAFVFWLAWRQSEPLPVGARFVNLLRGALCMTAGAAIPLAAYSVPYIAAGAFGDLMYGVFVLPAERLSSASAPPPPLLLSALALVFAAACLAFLDRIRPAIAMIIVAALLLLPLADAAWHRMIILAGRAFIPVIVVIGLLLAAARRTDGAVPAVRQHAAVALFMVLALATLIQFPFSGPIYFLYVAPLGVLATAAAYALWPAAPRFASAGLLVVSLVFGLLWMNHLPVMSRGFYFVPGANTTEIALSRASGLRIRADDAAMHERVVELLRTHSRGEYTYAGPDAPHLYFLSGLRNPTPYLFEFFADPADREQQLLSAIDSLDIKSIAVNRAPHFTPYFSPDFLDAISTRFPAVEAVGYFVVLWRD